MSGITFESWARDFVRDAEADGFVLMRRLLRRTRAPGTPVNLVATTIRMLHKCRGFAQPLQQLFRSQTYDPERAKRAVYSLTFDVGYKTSARILVKDMDEVDLVDLNWIHWKDLKTIGFLRFWINRIDDRRLADWETVELTDAVQDDFYADYPKEQLSLDICPKPRSLLVELADDSVDTDTELLLGLRTAFANKRADGLCDIDALLAEIGFGPKKTVPVGRTKSLRKT
jgi:hypothetical protein